MAFRDWARDHFVSAEAIYGLILYTVLIAAVSDEDASALDVLVVSSFSLVIFWMAHVFAATVAGHGQLRLRSALWNGLDHSSGMLYAAVLPFIALLAGVFGWVNVDTAVSISLLVAVVVLGVLGYRSFAERKSPVIIRLLGGLATAAFGLVVIVLNIIVH